MMSLHAPAANDGPEGPSDALESSVANVVTGDPSEELHRSFLDLKKAVKMALFNRHRPDQLDQYAAQPWARLAPILDAREACELKLEVSTLLYGDTPILEDDAGDGNLVYPLWAAGVRLLVLRKGLKAADLLRFFMIVASFKRGGDGDDLATALWKEDFVGIEWVIVQDLEMGDAAESEGVEVEVDRVIALLQDRLRSDAPRESVAFARLTPADLDAKLEHLDQLRRATLNVDGGDAVVQRNLREEVSQDEQRLLQRVCGVLLQVMALPATAREAEDFEKALEQLLDGLILDGQLGAVDDLLHRCEKAARDPEAPPSSRELARRATERLTELMHEGQRVRGIGTALNAGRVRDLDGLRRYLTHLGPTVTLLLLDLLDTLASPAHRRAIADVLVQVGPQGVPIFARRLPTASSNLARDLLYVIDAIDPPGKLTLFAPILKHENALLRMEGLTAIARTKTKECFDIIADVLVNHEVPQMRGHAARLLAEYPAGWAEPLLLRAVNDPRIDEKAEGERRALFSAIVKVESPGARSWVRSVLAEKSGILRGKKVDERKHMIVAALASAPGMPSLTLLAEIAKDDKVHTRDVCDAARAAALVMKRKLLGDPGASAA